MHGWWDKSNDDQSGVEDDDLSRNPRGQFSGGQNSTDTSRTQDQTGTPSETQESDEDRRDTTKHPQRLV